MNIITAGCSFTKYKWQCWPNFVSWFEQNHTVINLDNAGSSNETILRTVYNAVAKYNDIKKIYVMWSGPNRYEVVSETKQKKQKLDATYNSYNQDFDWYEYYGGHVDRNKHTFYQKHFLNEKQDEIRLLEKILFTQLLLDRHKIDCQMMVFKGNILNHNTNTMSKGQLALYNNIDWNKFIFYKDKKGLYEYAIDKFPKEFASADDKHPLPLTHYNWTKEIMYKSEIQAPANEMKKLINFKNSLPTTA